MRAPRPHAGAFGVAAYLGMTLLVALSPLLGGRWAMPIPAPDLAFWLITTGTAGCVIAAVSLLTAAYRSDTAELGLLGSMLFAISILPLAHGLTLPGVLVGDNGATWMAALLAFPCAAVAALPLLQPHGRVGVAVGRRWRKPVGMHVAVVTVLAVALTAWPTAWPMPDSTNPFVLSVAGSGMLVIGTLAVRHLRLFVIGRHAGSLIAGLGFLNISVSALVWAAPAAYTPGWWGVHLLDVTGVFMALGGLYLTRPDPHLRRILAPVLDADPLVAMELGLSPVVVGFITSLGHKDDGTRRHVVRSAELAMRLGLRVGMSPTRLRTLGLAALLHDVGKINVPDAILAKPGRLTPEEFEQVSHHPRDGWAMLQGTRTLRKVAPLVRGHHERPDGCGYPDGLDAADISLDQGLISVVDAYDAMTNSRQYRVGMERDRALAILAEHTGSQFMPQAVELLKAHLADPVTTAPRSPESSPLHAVPPLKTSDPGSDGVFAGIGADMADPDRIC